jgi:hypothetical protein
VAKQFYNQGILYSCHFTNFAIYFFHLAKRRDVYYNVQYICCFSSFSQQPIRVYNKNQIMNPLEPSGYVIYHQFQRSETLCSADKVHLCVSCGSQIKNYTPKGSRNQGRPLKRLLQACDRNGSTSGPSL